MVMLVVVFVIAVFLLCLGVVGLMQKELLGIFIVAFALILLVVTTFLAAPRDIPSGLPTTSIGGGEYKTAFVYVAGENVNVGIELKGEKETERLYLYQFPKSAFEGSINPNSKKLVVIESGRFRKLILK